MDAAERDRRGRSATIHGRVARLLAVPLVAVLLLLGDLVLKEIDEYHAADGATATVELGMSAQDLVHELQYERDLTGVVLAGDARWRADLVAQRVKVDAARSALEGVRDAEGPGPEAVYAVVRQLDDLGRVRVEADTGRTARQPAAQWYTDRIAALNRLDTGLDAPFPDPDPELRRGLAALQALSGAKESGSAARGLIGAAYVRGRLEDGERADLSTLIAAKRVALAEVSRYASPRALDRLKAATTGPDGTEVTAAEQAALDAAPEGDPADWLRASTVLTDELGAVQGIVADDVRARTDDLRGEAIFDLSGLGVGILFALIAGLLLGRSASTGITRPLARLASEADAAASQRLPAAVARLHEGETTGPPPPVAVPARATAEIRSVTEALNRLQSSAYGLAAEQAVLRRNTADSMANLGRRNQNLLRRQLSFITQLEREETDPAGLANLFELDHLATRMRRNAESLLVLVGEATPRSWSRPLPMADVLRSALAEVEDYRRVSLRRIDDAFVPGAYVADLAHMVAELVENGLTFSPPDFDVEVHGRWVDREAYLIAIVDQGVGMSPEELARANARLAGAEPFSVAPTKYLGHYVVGHLAGKLGMTVEICQSPVTGTTARVKVPASLLVAPPAENVPASTPTTTFHIDAVPVPAPASAPPAPAPRTPAPVPRTPVPAPVAPAAPEAEVTPNGLVKRVPRHRRGPAGGAVPRQGPRGAGNGTAARLAAERPVPADIGATMTALRRGLHLGRAASEGTTHDGFDDENGKAR
ncbi:sensor histidine kinase [Catenuloplanes atrovinosus]|uniref:histidine kinase n=1 Tax=Catenuloplanes atrovinosus TaxID=137266 RepID=A0AAE3YXU0_9ACTN|nr:nitrate- and nitrite sensing domain-containing protein [Catenuloplanes atrovinosus]MDR7280383.1 signal transduction histidine kinase [Catenuloplanes atrovinosus]